MMGAMNMNTVAILHDVHDAEWVWTHKQVFQNVHLVATHASVIDHLEPRGIGCEYLSSYLKNQELLDSYADSEAVKSVLAELDDALSPAINEKISMDPPLHYFYDCYRYLGRYEYFNHHKLEVALERLVDSQNADRLILFKPHSSISAPSFFATGLDVFEIFLKRKNIPLETLLTPVSKSLTGKEKHRHRLSKLKRISWFVRSRLVSEVINGRIKKKRMEEAGRFPISIKLDTPIQSIVVSLDGVHSAELLPVDYQLERALQVSLTDLTDKDAPANPALDWVDLIAESEQLRTETKKLLEMKGYDGKSLLKAILLDDFVSNFKNYLIPLLRLKWLEESAPIRGVIWTNPPTLPGAKPLIVERTLKQRKWVVGRQHGGNYGIEKSHPRHFDSDYLWCSHFLSFGFTMNDLMKTDPPRIPHCEILPLGIPRKTAERAKGKKKHVDLLFPVSNATYFHRDSVRPLQHDLAQYQRRLLCFLDEWQDRRVLLKPFYLYDYATSSFSELLRSLKNVEIVDHLSLTECFEEFDIRSVAIEYISSPLFECLQFDVEVLAMKNPLIPFSAEVDELLRRRVHFFDDLHGLEAGITDLFLGKLPQLRDPKFVDRILRPYDKSIGSKFWNEKLNRELTS
jgi:hypothetical protein